MYRKHRPASNRKLAPAWALYFRVSDEDRQRPEISIPAQRHDITQRLVQPSGLPVYREYTDLVSGSSIEGRDDFQQMLADAEAGRFSHLGMQSWDRFARNLKDALDTEERLRAWGITICAANLAGVDSSTPGGWLTKTTQQMIADWYNRQIRDWVINRMQQKTRDGYWCWKAPDGYLTRREYSSPQKYTRYIEPDPQRAPLLASVFEKYATGRYGLMDLVRDLNSQGYRQACGSPWTHQALRRLLTNPFYMGRLHSKCWGIEAPGKHEPIVDQRTFDECQRVLAQRNVRPPKRRFTYPLGAVLWSLELDARMYCTTCRGERCDWTPYYYTVARCQGKRIYVQAAPIEAQIPDLLSRVQVPPALHPALRADYEQDLQRAMDRRWPDERRRLDQQLHTLENEHRNLLRLATKGLIDDEEFARGRAELEREQGVVRGKIQAFTRGKIEEIHKVDQALALLAVAAEIWPRAADPADRKALVELVFRRIVVDRRGAVVAVDLWPPLDWLSQRKAPSPSPTALPIPGSIPGLLGGPTAPDLEPLPWPAPHLRLALTRLLAA